MKTFDATVPANLKNKNYEKNFFAFPNRFLLIGKKLMSNKY